MSKIKLKRGDDESLLVEVQAEQNDGTLLPFDLSHTARADLHAKANGKVVLQLSTENNSIQWQNRERGQLFLDISHELTENADWLTADYDLQLIDQHSKRKTVLSGRIELSPDVTKID